MRQAKKIHAQMIGLSGQKSAIYKKNKRKKANTKDAEKPINEEERKRIKKNPTKPRENKSVLRCLVNKTLPSKSCHEVMTRALKSGMANNVGAKSDYVLFLAPVHADITAPIKLQPKN